MLIIGRQKGYPGMAREREVREEGYRGKKSPASYHGSSEGKDSKPDTEPFISWRFRGVTHDLPFPEGVVFQFH